MVAALFTGAVAAIDEKSLGDVYANYLYADNAFNTTGKDFNISQQMDGWTNGITGASASFVKELNSDKYYIADSAESAATSTVAGVYTKTLTNNESKTLTYIINVRYPSVSLVGTVYDGATPIANLLGGTANTDNQIAIAVGGNSVVVPYAKLALTNPDNSFTDLFDNIAKTGIKDWDLGVWTIQPVFNKSGTFSNLSPSYMYGEESTFTIVSADTTKSIAAASESVTQGGYVTIVLTAPYDTYYVGVDKEATIPGNQPSVEMAPGSVAGNPDVKAYVKVGTSGEQTFVVKSLTSNDFKVTLYNDDKTTVKKQITVKVTAGAITAVADKESVYIGDEFDIEGTNDLGGNVYFYLKGTNYPLSLYKEGGKAVVGSGKVWDATIDTAELTDPDAGVYTIYVAKNTSTWNADLPGMKTDDFDNTSRFDAYTTLSISFIQPFITANVANGVVVQGDKLNVYGTAEGNPSDVLLYVFGTNFFKTATTSVLDDGTYSFTQKIVATDKDATDAWPMATGQYFLVAQHKMYDQTYNIGPMPAGDGSYNIVLNESGPFDGINGTIIFNTLKRQSANAAQALIDAIGSQNIDDMQAHLSFIVAGPTSYVNAVPSQVVKGQKLVISGTTTGHTNEVVAVELLSTAFAAVPKETVGSAAFATVITRIGDDGVWTVEFDTSNLNADDYTVSIAVGSLGPVTAETKIVDPSAPTTAPTAGPTAGPTAKPTAQPTTTPSTPGFGALAALAGLGAVAVLLLRRE